MTLGEQIVSMAVIGLVFGWVGTAVVGFLSGVTNSRRQKRIDWYERRLMDDLDQRRPDNDK
jgi:hypothetical protein